MAAMVQTKLGQVNHGFTWAVATSRANAGYEADPHEAFTMYDDHDLTIDGDLDQNLDLDQYQSQDQDKDGHKHDRSASSEEEDMTATPVHSELTPRLALLSTDPLSPTAPTDDPPPVRRQRRRRSRMTAEERKVRHREVQREFMKRKRARIAELKKVARPLEKQLQILQLRQECEHLQHENERLTTQHESGRPFSVIKEEPSESTHASLLPELCSDPDLLFHDFPWDDIIEAVSDDEALSEEDRVRAERSASV